MSASAAQRGGRGVGGSRLIFFALASLVAAGVDAMRVVSNAEMHEHHMMDAKGELVCTKGIEMFCESIPGET